MLNEFDHKESSFFFFWFQLEYSALDAKLNTDCSLHERFTVIRSSNGDISKLFIVTISQPLVV